MSLSGRTWLDGLREFSASRRRSKPLASGTGPAAAAERMILGSAIANRLGGLDQIRAARRDWLTIRATAAASGDHDPAVVLTTSAIGISITDALLVSNESLRLLARDTVVPVTELEYRLWCIGHPDEEHRLHINLWSWVKTSVPRQRWTEFARHPLGDGETYWLHREGLAGAGAADRRSCHLWRWNGGHAELLETFVLERAAQRLGGFESD